MSAGGHSSKPWQRMHAAAPADQAADNWRTFRAPTEANPRRTP
jgi:hypothetical protein